MSRMNYILIVCLVLLLGLIFGGISDTPKPNKEGQIISYLQSMAYSECGRKRIISLEEDHESRLEALLNSVRNNEKYLSIAVHSFNMSDILVVYYEDTLPSPLLNYKKATSASLIRLAAKEKRPFVYGTCSRRGFNCVLEMRPDGSFRPEKPIDL